MDKQLKQLKTQFENNIPTSFTEKDKQGIRSKIKEFNNRQTRKRKTFHLYPALLTGVVLTVAVLIFVVTANNQPDMFMSSMDRATDTSHDEEANSDQAETQMAESFSKEMNELPSTENSAGIAKESSYMLFDPETIEEGTRFIDMQVIKVQRKNDQTVLSFIGKASISGTFMEGEQLMFKPSKDSLQTIPLATGDEARNVSFFFKDSVAARAIYEGSESKVVDLNIGGLDYHYSPDGSSIYLEIPDDYALGTRNSLEEDNPTITYETTVELTNELHEIYSQYQESYDDKLLIGLNPVDVFKLFLYANAEGDAEVQYALYNREEIDSFYPDIDAFLSEYSYSEEDANESYQELMQVNTFNEVYLSDEEVLITYSVYEPNWIGFRMLKDTELGVWKVSWMPIQ